jgi:hypothetical protein
LTTLAMARARAKKTFIVQASLMIITYDRKNIFIVKATGACNLKLFTVVIVAI